MIKYMLNPMTTPMRSNIIVELANLPAVTWFWRIIFLGIAIGIFVWLVRSAIESVKGAAKGARLTSVLDEIVLGLLTIGALALLWNVTLGVIISTIANVFSFLWTTVFKPIIEFIFQIRL